MSRKTVLSRPRTRLYDANYNIGESYYRPALDRLDRKYSGRPLSPPRRLNAENTERHAKRAAEENVENKKEIKTENGKKGNTVERHVKFVAEEETKVKKEEVRSVNGNVTEHRGNVSNGEAVEMKKKKKSIAEDIAERHAKFFADEDLEISRKRAGKHIREQNLFDSRGALIGRRAPDNFENDFNDETVTSIKSIRASRKVAAVDDVDLENISNNLKSHRLLNRSEKILDSVGISDSPRRAIEEGSSYKRKALKVTFDGDSGDVQKWAPVENSVASVKSRREEITAIRARKDDRSEITSESSAAAIRARQTKEKINDIEEEMAALAEKQAAREARVARLRALVAETEQESEAFEVAQAAAERKSVRREKYEL